MTSSPWRAASRPIPASAAIFRPRATPAGIRLFVPPLKLCGDNAAMIGCQAYYEYLRGRTRRQRAQRLGEYGDLRGAVLWACMTATGAA